MVLSPTVHVLDYVRDVGDVLRPDLEPNQNNLSEAGVCTIWISHRRQAYHMQVQHEPTCRRSAKTYFVALIQNNTEHTPSPGGEESY